MTLTAPPRAHDHSLSTGKLNRGIATVDTVEIIKGSELDADEYKRAAILGWCIELVRFVGPFPSFLSTRALARPLACLLARPDSGRARTHSCKRTSSSRTT